MTFKLEILIVLIANVSFTFGWTLLELDDGSGLKQTNYADFDPSTTRIQMRLTQLLPADNLAFSMDFLFFEEERQTSLIGTLFFRWNTKSGHESNVYLSISNTFTDCLENQSDMLLIPSFSTIDLNTDYLVENDEKYKGNFKDNCEEVNDWNTWRDDVSKIKKMKVKLTDQNYGTQVLDYTALQDYFTVDYRLIQACPPGQYLSKNDGCTDCSADSYYGGGFAKSCTDCPTVKTVAAGIGTKESDCTWKPCPGGQYLDETNGCISCSAGYYSVGGSVASCTPCDADKYSTAGSGSCTDCPTRKTVAAGTGTQESDCTWNACPSGQYMDQTNGCISCLAGYHSAGGSVASCSPCDADKYSTAGSGSCTDCPTRKTIAAGTGTKESDCTWKPCLGGKYLEQTNGCTSCSAGQYSVGGSVASCTPCDADKYSAAGSGSCTDCPAGKTVAAGKGTQESDCSSGKGLDDSDSGSSSIGIRTTGVLAVLKISLLLL